MVPYYPFKEERKILRKYRDGLEIEPDDIEILDELATVGLIRRGFSLSSNSETAIATAMAQILIAEN